MSRAQFPRMDDKGKARNDEIELQLKKDRMSMKNEVRTLLIGPAGSGKSTFLARMKLMYQGGYNNQERESYRSAVFSSTLLSMRATLEAMPALDLQLQPQNDARRVIIMSLPDQIEADLLPCDVAEALSNLWEDASVREAVRRGREFQLDDSATYYFNSLGRISSPTYLPTDRDIMSCPVKNAGVTETPLRFGELTYKLFNVRGQGYGRKKWIHHFDNVTALVFLVSLAEYDQTLYEDGGINRMQESLTLFDSICNSSWFKRTPIILLLNKVDLFADKLPHSPLHDFFPDYDGGNDYDSARNYLLSRFVSLNQNGLRRIYAHFICATDLTDTQLVKFFLSAVQDSLLETHLDDILQRRVSST